MEAQENELQKLQISLNEILRMTISRVFLIPLKFKILHDRHKVKKSYLVLVLTKSKHLQG